jgi:ABC-type thiamin/hydroxymethylpyrimidine transport system permease subunit
MLATPILFFPVAAVILARVLPHVFGYVPLVLGAVFAILGVVVLFSPLQYVVDGLSIIRGFWLLIAAITLLVREGKTSDTAAVQEREGMTA